MQRQTELLESLLEFGQTPLRRRSVLEPDHEVIRPSHDDYIAADALRLSPVIDPEVENVMKENVRQQRGEYAPYTKGNFQFVRTIAGWREKCALLDLRRKR
jgi:hypothetical protein